MILLDVASVCELLHMATYFGCRKTLDQRLRVVTMTQQGFHDVVAQRIAPCFTLRRRTGNHCRHASMCEECQGQLVASFAAVFRNCLTTNMGILA
jgi:hypothetical protein